MCVHTQELNFLCSRRTQCLGEEGKHNIANSHFGLGKALQSSGF